METYKVYYADLSHLYFFNLYRNTPHVNDSIACNAWAKGTLRTVRNIKVTPSIVSIIRKWCFVIQLQNTRTMYIYNGYVFFFFFFYHQLTSQCVIQLMKSNTDTSVSVWHTDALLMLQKLRAYPLNAYGSTNLRIRFCHR